MGDIDTDEISLNAFQDSGAYQGTDKETQNCIDLAGKIGKNLGDHEIITVLMMQTISVINILRLASLKIKFHNLYLNPNPLSLKPMLLNKLLNLSLNPNPLSLKPMLLNKFLNLYLKPNPLSLKPMLLKKFLNLNLNPTLLKSMMKYRRLGR